MQRNFKVKKRTALDALQDIEDFMVDMEKNKEKRPQRNYKYEIKIYPIETKEYKWEVDLKLISDE